jgi:hypothetical protein
VIVAETVSVPQSKYLNDLGILICRLASFRHVGFSTPNCSTKNCLSVILIATSTAGCTTITSDAQITAAPIAAPADYRKIISEGTPAPMTKGAQVSDLRETRGAQPGDWMACVKSNTNPYTGFFAVFIADGKVKDFRRSIGIDQCESAMYSLLPSPPAVQENNKPGKRKKVDST